MQHWAVKRLPGKERPSLLQKHSSEGVLQNRRSQRGLEARKFRLFLWHNFNELMEKEPCTKFCGVLISSYEVMSYKVLNPV